MRPPRAAGRGGAPGRPGLGVLFARWDDPFTWSVRVGSFRGFRVGVHWITVFWAIAMGLLAIPLDRIGPQHIAMAVGSVLLVTLLREGGRLTIARAVGGEPEYVVLWPLGALIAPTPPRALAPKLLITLTPTLLSAAFGVVLLFTLWMMGVKAELLWFNPFNLRALVGALPSPHAAIVWWMAYANLVVGALNLLPMLPMDGGRLLEAWAWQTRRDRARRVMGLLTLLVAGLLAVTGIVNKDAEIFILLSVFGGWAGWVELRRSEFVEEPPYVSPGLPPDWIVGAGETADEPPPAEPPEPPAPELSDSAVIDGILAKISAAGMGSLSDEERQALARATRRLKGE